jgi:hypothetical protein
MAQCLLIFLSLPDVSTYACDAGNLSLPCRAEPLLCSGCRSHACSVESSFLLVIERLSGTHQLLFIRVEDAGRLLGEGSQNQSCPADPRCGSFRLPGEKNDLCREWKRGVVKTLQRVGPILGDWQSGVDRKSVAFSEPTVTTPTVLVEPVASLGGRRGGVRY